MKQKFLRKEGPDEVSLLKLIVIATVFGTVALIVITALIYNVGI
jgi:hypothetical protein